MPIPSVTLMGFLPDVVTRPPRAIQLWMNHSYLNKKDSVSKVSVSHHCHPNKQRQGPRNSQNTLRHSPSGPFESCRTPSRAIKQRPRARSTYLSSSLICTFHMLPFHLLYIYWFEAFDSNNHSFLLNLIAFLPISYQTWQLVKANWQQKAAVAHGDIGKHWVCVNKAVSLSTGTCTPQAA